MFEGSRMMGVMMDRLGAYAQTKAWPVGSEMEKLKRFSNPQTAEDLGLSVDFVKALKEAGFVTDEDLARWKAEAEFMASLARDLGKSAANRMSETIIESMGLKR